MDSPEKLFSYANFISLSRDVQERVRSLSWFERHGHEWIVLGLRGALWLSALAVFFQQGIVFKIIGLVVLSYSYYGIAITATHETAHQSFVSSKKLNRVLAYFFADFWAGLSSASWFNSHVQVHHVATNVTSEEPQQFYFPWLSKYLYFFVAPFFVVIYLGGQTIHFLWGSWRKLFLSLILLITGVAFHTYIFYLAVGSLPLALLCTFIMRSLFAPLFLHLSIFNHLGMENPATRLPWLPLQTKTTRNLKAHWFLIGIGGNAFVQCHIEHHLFPSFSNRLLHMIRPIVREYLLKEGYTYAEETYWRCLRNCLKYYDRLFSVWGEAEL